MRLIRIPMADAERLWRMQREAFYDLYLRYGDGDLSPATEPLARVQERLGRESTYCYFIDVDGLTVGAVRVYDTMQPTEPKRLSQIFVLKRYRGQGYAQQAIHLVETLHGDSNWVLDTILQERGNCYLYEKLGYRQTGHTQTINERMTIVYYRKE